MSSQPKYTRQALLDSLPPLKSIEDTVAWGLGNEKLACLVWIELHREFYDHLCWVYANRGDKVEFPTEHYPALLWAT
jgi:hypothetical protein